MRYPIIKDLTNRKYQICKSCVMDTSDSGITFDSDGICMRCNEFKSRIEPVWNHGKGHEEELKKLLNDVKKSGIGKEYDCVLGFSGGLDSSYMLHLAVREWGLRPYVFHIDCGWDLPDTKKNIKIITEKLGVELHVKEMNWTEMREMQLAWFRTGLGALDVPQDHAFLALLDDLSLKLGIKYILNGYNITTEAVADPISWAKGSGRTLDTVFVKDVIRKHCRIPIKEYTFTNGLKHKFIIPYLKGVKTIKPLNLVEFTKEEMVNTLVDEYGYIPYQQKHFEDLLTKFIEGYWNPIRFGHDIRRVWLSALVITGQMTRDDALKALEKPILSEEECSEMFSEVARRLEITEDELRAFLEMPECSTKYKTRQMMYKIGLKLYEVLGLENRIRK